MISVYSTAAQRLSLFSFLSISFYSFTLAFFPLYCKSIGFSPLDLSTLSTLSTVATILAAPIALQITHRLLSPRLMAVLLAASAIPLYACLYVLPSEALWIFGLYFLITLFKRGLDSIVEAETIRRSALGELKFEHIRVWGSIGFILFSFLLGSIADSHGAESIVHSGALLVVGIYLATLYIRPILAVEPRYRTLTDLSKTTNYNYWPLRLVLLSTCLNWASHGPFYVFLSVYLEELQWSTTAISLAWTVGVLAEVLFFVIFPWLERRIGALPIFYWSLAATILRWLLLGTITSTPGILASQLLHAFSFAGVYLTSIRLTYLYSIDAMKERNQGILVAIGQGTGALVGRVATGVAAVSLSSYLELQQLFLWAAGAALLALVLAAPISTNDAQAQHLLDD